MSDARVRDAIDRAIERFDAGDWKAALDAFEVPYHETAGKSRDLWLALVRASAALHHAEAGHPLSVRRLHASARALLAGLTPAAEGIDVRALAADLDRALSPFHADGAGNGTRPAFRPRIRRP